MVLVDDDFFCSVLAQHKTDRDKDNVLQPSHAAVNEFESKIQHGLLSLSLLRSVWTLILQSTLVLCHLGIYIYIYRHTLCATRIAVVAVAHHFRRCRCRITESL